MARRLSVSFFPEITVFCATVLAAVTLACSGPDDARNTHVKLLQSRFTHVSREKKKLAALQIAVKSNLDQLSQTTKEWANNNKIMQNLPEGVEKVRMAKMVFEQGPKVIVALLMETRKLLYEIEKILPGTMKKHLDRIIQLKGELQSIALE